MAAERETLKHPSFGQISLIKTSANNQRFYGSELTADHYVSLEIHESEMHRDLSHTSYYQGKLLTRVRFTPNQFSEMIMNMNTTGVPCTIEQIVGRETEELPAVESGKTFTHRKFKDRMVMFAKTLRERQAEAKKIVAKKTLSKDDQQSLVNLLDMLINETASNIPFFAECFQEVMDDVVKDAKAEIEAAITHKVTSLGLEALHNQQNLLK